MPSAIRQASCLPAETRWQPILQHANRAIRFFKPSTVILFKSAISIQKSEIRSGVMAERDHWVGACRAMGRDVAGEQSDRAERNRNNDERGQVKRADVIKQS